MRKFLDRRPWLITVAAAVVMGVVLTVLGFTAPEPATSHQGTADTRTADG